MNYTLLRSKQRRRSLSLHLDPNGEVIVRAPLRTPKLYIDHFVRTKSAWIAKQQSKHASPRQPVTPHFTQDRLRQYIDSQVTRYASILDLYPTELKYKTVKSYWGNCTPSGRLTFNLALCYAPPQAVEYVVVHELVHLKHKGHGKQFWDVVTDTFPETSQMRKVLRNLGLPH